MYGAKAWRASISPARGDEAGHSISAAGQGQDWKARRVILLEDFGVSAAMQQLPRLEVNNKM